MNQHGDKLTGIYSKLMRPGCQLTLRLSFQQALQQWWTRVPHTSHAMTHSSQWGASRQPGCTAYLPQHLSLIGLVDIDAGLVRLL